MSVLFQLVKDMLGVFFDGSLKVRAHAGQEEHIAVGDGAAEQRRFAVLGRRTPGFLLGRRRARLGSAGENGASAKGSGSGGGVFQDGSATCFLSHYAFSSTGLGLGT